ncbi:MAG TPA: glycosyltransferase, partial [Candidatus Eisenbacteria bacterium]|nr:glycosyltransferase [Candidatus Eisenbacteria bacterium]
LWTRRLDPLYRPETFLEALARLRAKQVAFTATMAGDGAARPAVEERARALGVRDAIRFVGWVGDAELKALLSSHDVYVSLSRSDSTSQSLLEAMAAGLVSVVSDIEGNREWVTHRREGYLVPGDDAEAVSCAIAEIAAGSTSREPLGDAGAMADRARAKVAALARFEDTVGASEAHLEAISRAKT